MSGDAPPPPVDEGRLPIGDMPVRAYGKYYLVRKLAEGGMAEIFLAKQVGVEGFERNVVVKRMLPHLSSVPDFVGMFLDEARLAASLSHPNVVQITDLGLADGCYFICMEYLPGEDFSTVLRIARRRNTQVPLHVVLRVLAQAATGLHAAHEACDPSGKPIHLVHRDISPSNIFVTYSGQVKVLDFGIAKAESRATSTTAGVVKGKYQYMSPEQARGDAIDRRADVYALGVTAYESLTGQRPFARDTDLAILKAVLEGTCTPIEQLRPDLPPELVQLVSKMMAHEAADRPATALEVVQEVERYLAATTSASGGQMLANYMTAFFGPERVRSRTRIETLDQLAARGVDVPGRPGSAPARDTDPGTVPGTTASSSSSSPEAEGATRAIPLPASVTTDRRRRRLLVGAVVVTLVAAVVVAGALLRPRVTTPATPPIADVTSPQTPDAAVAAVEVMPEPELEVDAGAQAVEPEPEPPSRVPGLVKQRPVVLTSAMVVRTVGRAKGRIQQCFREHQGELPTARGRLTVEMAIDASGKVTSATSDLPGTGVSRCIEGVIKSLVFPRHVDRELRLALPLEWNVPR